MDRRVRGTILRFPGWLVLAMLVLAAAPSPAQENIRIGGTGAALGLFDRLATAYAKRSNIAKPEIAPSLGSTGGIKAVAEGALDIGLSARPLKEAERGQGLTAVEIARTPFVLAVGQHVNVERLSLPEIAAIYRGSVRTWPGGERIRIVLRPQTESDSAHIRSLSPELAAAVDDAMKREGMLIALTDQENAKLLENTPGAVGFIGLVQVITEQRRLKVLALDGVRPAEKGVVNSGYPHLRQLFIVTKGQHSPAVARFLRFIASPEGRRIQEAAGCIPVDARIP
jgi:phosphate transport system substrate-binding protein